MNVGAGVVTSVRVTHSTASLSAIESATPADDATTVQQLRDQPGVTEALLLSTCHRVEAYVVAEDRTTGESAIETVLDLPTSAAWATHRDSLHHLLSVAAGLDSVVLGEDQILGQVKDAAETAKGVDALGPILETTAMKAAHVGERARTETAINDGVVSMGSAAATFIADQVDLADDTALVVGAGEMARLAAKALANTDGIEYVVVANRTLDRAKTLAETLPTDAAATGLDTLDEALQSARVAITATASDTPIVDDAALATAGDTCIVDLGQPRDVAANVRPPTVDVYDLDDIETVTEAAAEHRRAAATTVESMVDAELQHLLDQLKRRRADDVIAAMYESADTVKRRELETAITKMEAADELTDEQRAVVSDLADALVSQLLAAPTRSLRDAAAEDDWETIHTALKLFNPEFEEGSPFEDTLPDVESAESTVDE